MKSKQPSSLKQKWTLAGALTLTTGLVSLAVWFVVATSNHIPRELQAAAQRGEIEPGTFWVTNRNGGVAAVHYWQPTGSNAQNIVFEPQGDHVLVRAVPQATQRSPAPGKGMATPRGRSPTDPR